MASVVAAQQQASSYNRKLLWRRPALLSLLLVVITVSLYYPVHEHPFINYDDNEYVYQNPHVLSGLSWSTVVWAFTTSSAANWHPLTWLTHAAACQLFANHPAGHHGVNVVFHTLNAVLLFWVLFRATGFPGRSFMVAALLALHPINVETVAWVAELKTSLSTAFFLLALGAYGWYARRPCPARMTAVCVSFALGLMAKPQIIALPFILLLWDYWPLERWTPKPPVGSAEPILLPQMAAESWRSLVNEKRPLFILAAASATLTLYAQHHARIWYPVSARLGNAVLSYGLYLRKAVWPSELALLYPHPGRSLCWLPIVSSAVVLSGITAFVILNRGRRYLVVGWLWFAVSLVPMLGIVQVGVQAMADRYGYVSFIGLFIMVCWGVEDLAACARVPRCAVLAGSGLALLALALVARHQLNYWGTEEDLWRHALQVTDRNWVAESELGAVLAMQGNVSAAVPHFNKALAINPDDVTSNMGLAIYELQSHNFPEAVRHYRLVVKQPLVKTSIMQQAYLGLAKAYKAIGEDDRSRDALRKAKMVTGP